MRTQLPPVTMADIPIDRWLSASDARIGESRQTADRPRPSVTISYAQSINGVIAAQRGQQTQLSCPESMRLTHRLRAMHEAILVGIGTVRSDDPQLTVRLTPGQSPRPVILDSQAQTPPTARLMATAPATRPIICCALDSDSRRQDQLREMGADLLLCRSSEPRGSAGGFGLCLSDVLEQLAERGITRLMVEGGARVIQSFLAKRLVDRAVVTMVPTWMDGVALLETPSSQSIANPTDCIHNKLYRYETARSGTDTIIWGEFIS